MKMRSVDLCRVDASAGVDIREPAAVSDDYFNLRKVV